MTKIYFWRCDFIIIFLVGVLCKELGSSGQCQFPDVKRLDRPRGSVTVLKGRLEFVNWVDQSSKKSDLI